MGGSCLGRRVLKWTRWLAGHPRIARDDIDSLHNRRDIWRLWHSNKSWVLVAGVLVGWKALVQLVWADAAALSERMVATIR